jgi:LacI family transcriptional regulator
MYKNFKKIVFLYSPRDDWGMWNGITEYASLHNHWLLYSPVSLQFEPDDSGILNWLKRFKPDGLIVPNSRENVDDILKLKIPIIVHRTLKKGVYHRPVIFGDGKAIGKMAAEYFISLGFQNFGYYIYENSIPMQERADSFSEKIAELDFNIHPFLKSMPENLILWDKELNLLAEWLRSLPKPVAILAGDDILGVNIILACKISELLIPQQVAVIGVDNTKTICETQIPKLSSISLSYHKAAFKAAELLDELINTKELYSDRKVVIEPTHIAKRQSTDFMAIEDEEVARAITYIHQNSNTLLQVRDVVEQTSLSRNILQKRFKKITGSTISREIRRVCINRIAEMLLNTNMSVSDIALSIGFSSSDHISRYFRKSKGISPSAYRKKYRIR